jgi:Icc-related predicted phosphoesterase
VTTSRVFFITDVHGSTRCFKKFLNAAKFYSANVLVLGGDITGKLLVPIIEQGDGSYRCTYEGDELSLKNKTEVDGIVAKSNDSGYYTQLMTRKEYEEIAADPNNVKAAFIKAMVDRVGEWVRLAEERLARTGVSCYISPGNDDTFDIDPVLTSSSYVVNPEGRVVSIDGGHEMITLGYTNHTPWNSPREVDEEELSKMIEGMVANLKSTKSAVFNIHAPPINTLIDKAPMVDDNLKVVVKGNQVQWISAGSSACRRAIETHQPLLGIHGHIHESKGIVKIGRTLCANPGSEYGEGILRGFLAQLEGDRVKSYLLTSG